MPAITPLQTAFILHSRPYRETSALVDFFTKEQGRLRAVVRGVRGGRSKNKRTLQVFTPLMINWSGRSSLVSIRTMEPAGMPHLFTGARLMSAMYLNELLMRLCTFTDPAPVLFQAYENALHALHDKEQTESVLRTFELQLLNGLGYGIDLQHEVLTDERIQPNAFYTFHAKQGFTLNDAEFLQNHSAVFKGEDLLAMAVYDFTATDVCRAAKRLMRLALTPLLGQKPIQTRELFKTKKVKEGEYA